VSSFTKRSGAALVRPGRCSLATRSRCPESVRFSEVQISPSPLGSHRSVIFEASPAALP
jgi:hypothetical protein